MKRSLPLNRPTLMSVSRDRLVATLAGIDQVEHPAMDLLASVVALSRCRFTVALKPHSVEALLDITPSMTGDPSAAGLRDVIVTSITDRARTSSGQCDASFSIDRKIRDAGFASLVILLVNTGARPDAIMEMADIVSTAMKTLIGALRALAGKHLRAVLDRDVPVISQGWTSLDAIQVWLLATHLSGDPRRPEILKRRRQALELFGSLSRILMEASITSAIDEGVPLIPALARRLDLSRAGLRSLRGAYDLKQAVVSYNPDLTTVVRELKAHSVPLHEWPGNGKPDQPQAWKNTPWLKTHATRLLRPDFFDPDNNEAQDAIAGFRDDILTPLIAQRVAVLYPRP